MKLLSLAVALPIGRIFDALEHLPEHIAITGRPLPVQVVAIEIRPPADAESLRSLCHRAVDGGAELLVAVGAQRLLAGEPLPLPVVSVAAGATLQAVSRRLKQLEHDSLSPRLPDEEYARTEIARVVDRAADALRGHIIVEDRDFQMLVYSRLAAPIDAARRDAIMQRRMPGYLQQVFNSQGVQASLISGEDVVEVAPDEAAGMGPRLVVAIRHRGRLVGTIWFARSIPEFSARDIATLQDAARQMSEPLAAALRRREDEQIRRDDAALDLLAGRRAAEALNELGIDGASYGDGAHVITFALAPGEAEGSAVRLVDFRVLVANSSWAVQNEAVTVAEGDRLQVVYFGCSGEPDCDAVGSRLLAGYFAESLQRVGIGVAVGIGRHASLPQDIADSAESANRVLSTLLRDGRADIATAGELWAPLLLDHFLEREGALESRAPAALERMLVERSDRNRELIVTVRTALDHWGDISGAARLLHVHHNTVRYRMQRFAELTGIDLENPDTRLAVWMLLRRAEMRDVAPAEAVLPS